jgi:hypothetical protein
MNEENDMADARAFCRLPRLDRQHRRGAHPYAAERFRCTKAVGVLKATHACRRQIRRVSSNRSPVFASWRRTPISIRISRGEISQLRRPRSDPTS